MSADVLVGLEEFPAVAQRRPDRRLHVVEHPQRARRPRLLYGIVAVAGALLIGAAQMGLSILTTQSSYQLSELTAQQRDLDWQKQILEEEVAGLSSPQYLAANAAALGLVTGQSPAYLRLSDGEIIGTAKSATSTTVLHALTQAAVSNALVAGVPLVTDPDSTLATGANVIDDAILNTTTPPAIAEGLPTPDTH
ncbi:MAG: hypothetical protein QM622_02095 [Microbacterium sp.]